MTPARLKVRSVILATSFVAVTALGTVYGAGLKLPGRNKQVRQCRRWKLTILTLPFSDVSIFPSRFGWMIDRPRRGGVRVYRTMVDVKRAA